MPNRKEFVGSHFMIHVPNLNVDRQLGMKSRILQGGASRGWDIDGPRKFKSLKHSHHGSGGDINDRKEVSATMVNALVFRGKEKQQSLWKKKTTASESDNLRVRNCPIAQVPTSHRPNCWSKVNLSYMTGWVSRTVKSLGKWRRSCYESCGLQDLFLVSLTWTRMIAIVLPWCYIAGVGIDRENIAVQANSWEMLEQHGSTTCQQITSVEEGQPPFNKGTWGVLTEISHNGST